MWLPLALGCVDADGPPPGTTAGAPCPDGSASVVAAADVPLDERWVPDTVVSTCADGPHAEDRADGSPAARGARSGGRRSGTWIRWTPDGRFDGAVDYGPDGVAVARREPTSDGRLLELELRDGLVVGWRTADPSPQPEWVGGASAPGTRYAGGQP